MLEAIKLPKEVAILHCKAHKPDSAEVTKGNSKANTDREARKATQRTLQAPLIPNRSAIPPQSSNLELEEGKKQRFPLTPEGWLKCPDDKFLLPEASQWKMLNIHQATHLEA